MAKYYWLSRKGLWFKNNTGTITLAWATYQEKPQNKGVAVGHKEDPGWGFLDLKGLGLNRGDEEQMIDDSCWYGHFRPKNWRKRILVFYKFKIVNTNI